ncbi:hypothetical protein [Melaminivora sp.]|uniref:hypothetical protein n=1 Tax=Melaminivora sp. TaxID=1933032 RepID=UPI0028A8E3E7|nr:hypothetical protein [Melaminivora sp.]
MALASLAWTSLPFARALEARPTLFAASQPRCAKAPPLRVIVHHEGDGGCRLVISGRMADVCAELDRLVLQ